MRFRNSEAKAFSGTNANAFTEVLDLVDRDGNVLKKFSKAADGSLTESTVQVTPAVARVIVGTIDTALAGTPAVLKFGNLTVTTVASGDGVPDDDDGTELIPYLAANKHLIPAQSVTDNTGGVFTITMLPGANTQAFVSADAQLTFAESVAGADQVSELVSFSVDIDDVEAASAGITVTELANPGSALRISKVALGAVPVTLANTTAISFGSKALVTFPAGGKIHIVSSNVVDFLWGLTNVGNATPIANTMGGDFSLGTTATSDSTLSGTDANVLASTSYDPFSASVDANSAINVFLAGGSTVYLNAIIDDGDVSDEASDILEANGNIYFAWYQLPE